MAAGVFYFGSAEAVFAQQQHEHDTSAQILAPGYRVLEYAAPEPGTYKLPPLGIPEDGLILDEQGREQPLHDFFGDKYVVLSFIYTSCSDVNGCPLATFVLGQLPQRLADDTYLKDHVRMISLSFDPDVDSPSVMTRYGRQFNRNNFDWRFFTTASTQQLQPVLRAFNQPVQKEYNETGEYAGVISHILRVFLIDKKRRIRNIYSVSFLHADTVINDIKTLVMEDKVDRDRVTGVGGSLKKHGPGDDKRGYETKSYRTNAKSLLSRRGAPADLIKTVEQPPLGLPEITIPENNPITRKKIELGKQLFFDRRLSYNNTFSCAMCHIPEQGFTSHELATAIGVEGRTVRRNAPTIYNVGFMRNLFHDARENLLEQQVWTPLLTHNEMANPSVGFVVEKLKSIKDYANKFEQVFHGKGPGMETIGMALASYQRTLNSANSPFDRWYYGRDSKAMDEQAITGFELFTGKARCVSCHTINKDYALFMDHKLHNTGIGYLDAIGSPDDKQQITVAPGVRLTIDRAAVAEASEPEPNDLGYYEITGNPDDRWKYKTPTLRNVSLTAPYMHNGSLRTLRQVVEFYHQGGIKNEILDPLIQPLKLNDNEINSLIAFLNSLTGSNVDELIADAFAQPVGNVKQ